MKLDDRKSRGVRCRSTRGRPEPRSVTKRTLGLVAAVLVASAAAPGRQEVRSPNGKFVARLRLPAEVDVASSTATLWTARGLSLAPADLWLLSDDGRALAGVAPDAPGGKPVVQVVRDGAVLLSADAAALALPAAGAGDGLAIGGPVALLRAVERDGTRQHALDLLGRDGLVRRVDLATGAVRLPVPPSSDAPRRVETAASGATEPVFVGEWFAPDAVFAGEPLPVHVRGSLPTPAWRFAGFDLKAIGDGSALLLAPRGIAPPDGAISIQVLKGFDETAAVHGLAPGAYRLAVSGRNAPEEKPGEEMRSVRVLPAGALAFLERTGGFAGVHETFVLYADGRAEAARGTAPRRLRLATDEERAAVARAIARLPSAPPRRASGAGADFFRYELLWVADGHPIRAVRDDRTLEPELRALAEALAKLAASDAGERARFALDPFRSFVQVRTGSGGLLSAFGHDHRLMVRELSGTIELDRADLSRSTLSLRIEAGSLAVVDDESQKDRPEIEKEMNERVLEVGKFPEIEFSSRSVEPGAAEGDVRPVVVEGVLQLHGKSQTVRVPARLELREGSLRATGELKLKQSDFGIERTSAVGGTVKVADEVAISFDLLAVPG
jgi:polyisoprenoid-binding protein YceI